MTVNAKKKYIVITEEQYLIIKKYLKNEYLLKEYDDLRKEYDDLRKEYDDLRIIHEGKRRYFKNTLGLTDIFRFPRESNQYKHETKKPEKLTRALINTCSRIDDLVILPFAGSGTECAMSAKEGRRFIGFDIEEKYVKMANERCELIMKQPQLF